MSLKKSVHQLKHEEKFTEENIGSIRPSFGMHPKHYKSFINKKSVKFIKAGSRLKWKYLKN